MTLSVPRFVRDGDILVYPGLGWTKESRLTVSFKVGEPSWTTEQKQSVADILGHVTTAKEGVVAIEPEK